MLCQNCHENEANVHYTQTINGVKKEMVLCEECARKLGIGNISFSMPMSLSSIFGDFLEDYEQESLLPSFVKPSELQCNQCGMTYQEFINGGKFGCEHCYDVFADQIDHILKNIQGSNRHIGRRPYLAQNTAFQKETEGAKKMEKGPKSKQEKLQEDLKKAIAEERYEDAAKIRDEIKKLEK